MIRYFRQLIAYSGFATFVLVFASGPEYRVLGAQEAMVSLTFSHAGERVGQCRTLSQDELNELAPNMRRPKECPRERHPVHVRLTANERVLFAATLSPSGIWKDGKANIYKRIAMQSGDYRFLVAMNDSGSDTTYDFEQSVDMTISPGQNLVISFDDLLGAFRFE